MWRAVGRRWSLTSSVGPLLVLAAALLMATYYVPIEWLLYPGLALMIAIAIWDLRANTQAIPAKQKG